MEEPDKRPQTSWFEEVAAKYFSVWVWSVVVGITTTTDVSLVNFYPRARGGFLIILLAPLLALSGLAGLAAWYSLLRFFEGYILPTFFSTEWRGEKPERFLEMAVRYSFMSLAFRMLLGIADLVLSSPFGLVDR